MGRPGVILKSWWNALLGRAENPGLILDTAYEQFQNQLVDVKRGVADVATQKFAIQKMADDAQKEVDKLGKQAEDELQDGNEDLALRLLERKAQAQVQVEELVGELRDLEQQQLALEDTARTLDEQVTTFGRQRQVKKAQYRSAEAQVAIGDSMAGISQSAMDVGRAVARMEERQEQMEARAKAIPELVKRGVLSDVVAGGKSVLEREAQESQIKRDAARDLEAMKERLALSSGSTKTPKKPKATS